MKIGIAQINTIVGDLQGNTKLIKEAYQRLVKTGAELVVFPELTICGYPPLDLLYKRSFVQECLDKADELAAESTVPLIFGTPLFNDSGTGNDLFNGAYVCQNGNVVSKIKKRLLPTYDVFDEKRYFEPGKEAHVVELNGQRVGFTICEDIWVIGDKDNLYDINPVNELAAQGVDLMINLSASPWHLRKVGSRLKFLSHASRTLQCPSIYCNSIGGNDELVFDGGSKIVSKTGECKHLLAAFESDEAVIDISHLDEKPNVILPENDLQNIEKALVLGLKDYAQKTGFKKVVIGLSGGIDSAVTAVIAVKALGKDNVTGVSLPSSISSQHSRDDAKDLADNLGIAYHTVPIAGIVNSVEQSLSPIFEGLPLDVTEENIQARSRGIVLMAFSNKFGSMLLTTGNKSEMAVGYCTLYGDMAGGLAILSDVLKTLVFDLARYMNKDGEVIPDSTITKPPSAELRPNQKDEDSLPPYDVLDALLKMYVEDGLTRKDIIAKGYDKEIVDDIARKVDLNEYKRKQAPPGLKITSRAFGIGRRLPIVQKYVG